MYAPNKIFDKIGPKAVKDTFLYNIWFATRRLDFLVEVMSKKRGKFKDFALQGDPQIPSLSGESWSSHKENPEERARPLYCNDFEKSKWEYFLSSQ